MRKSRILIVDDEIDFSNGLREVFSIRGYEVEVAKDGLSALRLIVKNSFDAIILDIKMPGMDGIEVLKETQDLALRTPTILITGDHLVSEDLENPAKGAYAYLHKPYPILDLVALIDQAVAAKRGL